MGSLSGSIYINTALSFLIELPAFVVCGLLIDRIGRRPLFVWSLLLGGAACALRSHAFEPSGFLTQCSCLFSSPRCHVSGEGEPSFVCPEPCRDHLT